MIFFFERVQIMSNVGREQRKHKSAGDAQAVTKDHVISGFDENKFVEISDEFAGKAYQKQPLPEWRGFGFLVKSKREKWN